jgi:hypothetical protein
MAAAAIALLTASVFLATKNRELRKHLSQSQSEQEILTRQTQDLQHQLEARTPALVNGLPQSSEQPIDHLKVAAFMLVPSLRGASAISIVSVPVDTDLVVLKLQLEPSDFVKYRVEIEDAESRQGVWQSADLKPLSDADGQRQAVSFALRPNLLKQGNYVIQLQGVRANGRAELLSTYPFKTLLK